MMQVASVIELPVSPNEGEGREDFTARLWALVGELNEAAMFTVEPATITMVNLQVAVPEEWGYTAALFASELRIAVPYVPADARILKLQQTYFIPDASKWATPKLGAPAEVAGR